MGYPLFILSIGPNCFAPLCSQLLWVHETNGCCTLSNEYGNIDNGFFTGFYGSFSVGLNQQGNVFDKHRRQRSQSPI